MRLERGEECILGRGCEQTNMDGETVKSDLKGAVVAARSRSQQ